MSDSVCLAELRRKRASGFKRSSRYGCHYVSKNNEAQDRDVCLRGHAPSYRSGGSKNFEKVGAEDNLSVPSSFIANAHNEIYAFYTDKNGFLKKNMSQ